MRGYQVRKNYKVCWAVGILEKVVLRWRRRGVGLRGFKHDAESIDQTEDEDIVKVFRKQKVDAAIDEAVSRVLSMVESPDARQQYRRLLEKYRQAKVFSSYLFEIYPYCGLMHISHSILKPCYTNTICIRSGIIMDTLIHTNGQILYRTRTHLH